jgi:serine protease Do
VTVGVISAVRQSLSIEGAQFADMLQTDAAINRGNSGGPLLNLRGEVVGVNTAIYAPTGVFAGIGFAIPANRAKAIMAQLIEKGRVVRGWMGVEVMPLDEVLARQFGLQDTKGVLVNNVLPGSPAEKAGMKRGDVIVEFNGRKTPDQPALLDAVGRTPPKTKAALKVVREGKTVDLILVTGEAPSDPSERKDEKSDEKHSGSSVEDEGWEGARLMKASTALAEKYGFPTGEAGTVVVSVTPGSLAESAGLVEGDMVASVNQIKTPTPSAFLAAVKKGDIKKGMVFDLCRRGRWVYLTYQEPK